MTDAGTVTSTANPLLHTALARRPVKQRPRRRPRRVPAKGGCARRTGGVRQPRRRHGAVRRAVQVANRRLYMENMRIMEENLRLRERALLLREENRVLLHNLAGNSCQDQNTAAQGPEPATRS